MRELPETIDESIRQAWKVRRKQEVRNSQEAIVEAAKFLQMQEIEVTKEVVAELRAHADWQYCGDEPNRCSRGAGMSRAAAAPEVSVTITGVVAAPPRAPVRKAKAPAPRRAQTRRGGCCGR